MLGCSRPAYGMHSLMDEQFLTKLQEKGSMVQRAKVKARLTSVQMPRTEPLLPQRLIVHHGMTNLKKHTRNIGTAADRSAGTPKIV